jgi:hypothetical protein
VAGRPTRSKRTFQGFGDFGLRGVDMMRDDAAELDVRYHRALHQEIGKAARGLTPIDTGEMYRKWGSVVGLGGRRPLGSGLSELKPGDKSKIVNSAAHAAIIDGGRRMAKPRTFESSTIQRGKRKGKKRIARKPWPIGSLKRKQGVTKPALTAVESRADQIRAKVIARVERG